MLAKHSPRFSRFAPESEMPIRRLPRSLRSCLAVLAAAALTGHAAASTSVVINTSVLAPQTVGHEVDIAFDLTTSTANTVTISPFSSDAQLGAISLPHFGDVSGALPGTVRLGGSPNFHEYLQTVTLGSFLAFTFDTTALPVDPSDLPDDFAFFILIDGAPFDSGGPGGALLTLDFGIESPVLTLFTSATLPIREGTPPSVPEPDALLLVAVALVALAAAVPRRKVRTK